MTTPNRRLHLVSMTALDHYRSLLRRVDEFAAGVFREYGRLIACSPGCDSCCTLETVNAIEAWTLLSHAASLGSAERYAIRRRAEDGPGERGECVLLANGLCAVYAARPIICRTHGLPLYVDGTVDFCPRNFGGVGRIESPYILGLDALNTMLGAVNLRFQREHTDPFFQKERYVLRELFKSSVADIPSEKSPLE